MSGLEHRYHVCRVDGRDMPGGDRFGTRYFVLDPANDPAAYHALWQYGIVTENIALAVDIFDWLDEIDQANT